MLDAPAPARTGRRPRLASADQAHGGLAVDLGLYLVSLLFAGFTALTATLPPHGAWGRIAIWGYAAATLLVIVQLAGRRRWPRLAGTAARAWLTALTWAATALLPLVIEAAQRASGRTDRAQEEVIVVEHGAQRLLDTGTPYLSHAAIAALPPDERLLGYLPYQPGMVLLGLPRAIAGAAWWTDARVWFALVTAATVAGALFMLRRAGVGAPPLVRALQAATVVPVCTLTLAVGGDDLPVLGLCLLALAFAATRRYGLAGVAVGVAGAMKLFAWPVALVLLALAIVHRRGPRYALGAIGLPVLSLIPAFLVNAGAATENVIRFPLGKGLVQSPAESPFPGQLIAAHLPGGHTIATILLVLAGLAIAAWLLRRPPRDAFTAALVCAAGLLIAILLIPATRFGYLLYPIAYAVWAPALLTRTTLEQ
ncbi:glycosyltransferase 87 family protein [Rugosimonospora acidiphila]|uniref:Glycosyltransferase 87 family protein n=1 Tax=Rugosimonospora acidiphila TaxID=556531 RepID=A0ABP9S0Z0_9ACTN